MMPLSSPRPPPSLSPQQYPNIILYLVKKKKKTLVRQSQIVQSVIYRSDAVVTQVLTPAVLSLGSQLGLFPFAEYEWTKT